MKRILPLLIASVFSLHLNAQNFNGQWKGQFTDKSTSFVGWGGDKCDYVLELECRDKIVTGFSYTYFNEGGKRFYTICKLKGKIDRAVKTIEVTETERTKTNVPNNVRNCFQVHHLTYEKLGDEQILTGSWSPAPNQEGDCGYGTTSLIRRILQKNPAVNTNPIVKTVKPPVKLTPVKPKEIVINKPHIPVITKPVPKTNTITAPIAKNYPALEEVIKKPAEPRIEKIDIQPKITPAETEIGYQKRSSTLLKTIEIENKTFRVDLYDNGDIDGDSISLFFNGKLLLQHQRLSDKAITLTLKSDERKDINELIMYAENLGEIPPNTALMIVTDGENRYEVRISSDLEKSGVIRFVYKPKPGQ